MFRRSSSSPVPAAPAPAERRPVLTAGQHAYETRRAAAAGMTLDAWLNKKNKDAARAATEKLRTAKPGPTRKGILARLLDRAHKPLG